MRGTSTVDRRKRWSAFVQLLSSQKTATQSQIVRRESERASDIRTLNMADCAKHADSCCGLAALLGDSLLAAHWHHCATAGTVCNGYIPAANDRAPANNGQSCAVDFGPKQPQGFTVDSSLLPSKHLVKIMETFAPLIQEARPLNFGGQQRFYSEPAEIAEACEVIQ